MVEEVVLRRGPVVEEVVLRPSRNHPDAYASSGASLVWDESFVWDELEGFDDFGFGCGGSRALACLRSSFSTRPSMIDRLLAPT
jgi:hypothetical protein